MLPAEELPGRLRPGDGWLLCAFPHRVSTSCLKGSSSKRHLAIIFGGMLQSVR